MHAVSLSGYPELDEAIDEYIAARKEAAATGDDEVEKAAWVKFFALKVKFWAIDHPSD